MLVRKRGTSAGSRGPRRRFASRIRIPRTACWIILVLLFTLPGCTDCDPPANDNSEGLGGGIPWLVGDTGTIAGHIVSPAGDPLGSIEVQLVYPGDPHWPQEVAFGSTTDDDGRFAFHDVCRRCFVLVIRGKVMLELGVGAEMCAPRSGQQKGAVEQLVKWVKNSFFKWRKFIDEHDLQEQLAAWVREVNFETPNRATTEIPESRRQQELERLRPVRVVPENLAIRVPVFVGPTAEIMFEGRSYSMPPEAANIPGTAFVYEDRVRIVAGRFEAQHRRGTRADPPASLPEHRAAKLAAVHGSRARLYEMRQQIMNLGADAMALLTALVHGSPARRNEPVEQLYALFEEHGDEALRDAISQAVGIGSLSVIAVRRVLDAKQSGEQEQLDLEPSPAPTARTRRAASKRGAR